MQEATNIQRNNSNTSGQDLRWFIAEKGGRLICDTCGAAAIDYDDIAVEFVCGTCRELNKLRRRIDKLQAQIDRKLGRK